MAGAHDVTLVLTNGNGLSIQEEIGDADDTAGNYVTWKNMGGESFFKTRTDCFIGDIVSTDTGSNCTRYKLYVNGKDAGIQKLIANCQTTVQFRVKNPIGPIRAGSMIQIEQLA